MRSWASGCACLEALTGFGVASALAFYTNIAVNAPGHALTFVLIYWITEETTASRSGQAIVDRIRSRLDHIRHGEHSFVFQIFVVVRPAEIELCRASMKEKVPVHAYVGCSASRKTRPSNVLSQANPWPESEPTPRIAIHHGALAGCPTCRR